MKIAVIGGGAAGFFGAITCAETGIHEITIFERSPKLLSKVRVSGGGRCNVTHNCFEPAALSENYPRGARELKRSFYSFQASDTVEWFRKRGVQLKTENDGRMFPVTDDSETIAGCLMEAAALNGIEIRTRAEISSIKKLDNQFELLIDGTETKVFDRVLAACGGSPKPEGYALWKDLGHSIEPPVPSLFTFNVSGDPINQLSGIAVPASVRINGSSFQFSGPLLITHWGFSGPAVLKLSSWAARWLHERNYNFGFGINWMGGISLDELQSLISSKVAGKKTLLNDPMPGIPARLWFYLLERAKIDGGKRWAETGKKDLSRLTEVLTNCQFEARGKTTFKEEFVTCGGISLKEIDFKTMQSRIVPGLYFAGELIDVDGITGGFNFQNAWTTGWIAGKHLSL